MDEHGSKEISLQKKVTEKLSTQLFELQSTRRIMEHGPEDIVVPGMPDVAINEIFDLLFDIHIALLTDYIKFINLPEEYLLEWGKSVFDLLKSESGIAAITINIYKNEEFFINSEMAKLTAKHGIIPEELNGTFPRLDFDKNIIALLLKFITNSDYSGIGDPSSEDSESTRNLTKEDRVKRLNQVLHTVAFDPNLGSGQYFRTHFLKGDLPTREDITKMRVFLEKLKTFAPNFDPACEDLYKNIVSRFSNYLGFLVDWMNKPHPLPQQTSNTPVEPLTGPNQEGQEGKRRLPPLGKKPW